MRAERARGHLSQRSAGRPRPLRRYEVETMSASRIEAFSDGVLAIVITIMVLSLHRPHGATFGALRATTPSLLAYALSFLYVGIYWNNHHHLLKTVSRVTGSLMWSNLNLLFWLSLFPFTTAWMSENKFAPDTVATYGVVLVLAAIAYFLLQSVIVKVQRPASRHRTSSRVGQRLEGSDLSRVL